MFSVSCLGGGGGEGHAVFFVFVYLLMFCVVCFLFGRGEGGEKVMLVKGKWVLYASNPFDLVCFVFNLVSVSCFSVN